MPRNASVVFTNAAALCIPKAHATLSYGSQDTSTIMVMGLAAWHACRCSSMVRTALVPHDGHTAKFLISRNITVSGPSCLKAHEASFRLETCALWSSTGTWATSHWCQNSPNQ